MPTEHVPATGAEAPLAARDPDPSRAARRAELRARVLDAAWELTSAAGWDHVSMSAVAARARISRPTVYREFGNRAGLGHTLVVRETQQFLEQVAHTLDSGSTSTRAGLEAAVHFVLTEAELSPLIHAVVTAARQGSDSLLPYLTARADPVFDSAGELLRLWLTDRFPHVPEDDIETAADITVRMTVSHLILPSLQPAEAARYVALAVLRTLPENC